MTVTEDLAVDVVEGTGYLITVGDDHARLWWTGDHWSREEAEAMPYQDWNEAKRAMTELRDHSGSTIRTESP